jgi:hypothetical protein
MEFSLNWNEACKSKRPRAVPVSTEEINGSQAMDGDVSPADSND